MVEVPSKPNQARLDEDSVCLFSSLRTSRYCGHGVDLRVVSYLSASLFFRDRMGSVGRKWARRKMSKLSLRKDGICVGGWMIVITKYTGWRESKIVSEELTLYDD